MRRMLALVLGWIAALPAMAGTLRVEALDVGQGDAILITSPAGKRVLIDASIKSADVVGLLQQRGVTGLDLAVATHAHADHIGGMQAVIEALPVKLYTDSGIPHTTQTYLDLMAAIEAKEITYRPAQRGQSYSLDDGIRIEVLGPPQIPLSNTRSDLNSNSVVMRLSHGANCFLFTGDAEEPTEGELLRGGMEPCQVLKVAHHGSNHSSSDAFLRAVQPEVALISCGVANRYKHPGEETLDRLRSAGAEVYRTDLMGTVVVESDGKAISVRTEGKKEGLPPPVTSFVANEGTPPRPERAEPAPPATPAERPVATPTQTAPPVVTAPPAAREEETPPIRTKKKKKSQKTKGTASRVAAEPMPPPPTLSPALPATNAPAVPGELGCLFVSARSSSLYHPGACHIVERIWEGNRICWATEAEALAAGKTRSAACPEMKGAAP